MEMLKQCKHVTVVSKDFDICPVICGNQLESFGYLHPKPVCEGDPDCNFFDFSASAHSLKSFKLNVENVSDQVFDVLRILEKVDCRSFKCCLRTMCSMRSRHGTRICPSPFISSCLRANSTHSRKDSQDKRVRSSLHVLRTQVICVGVVDYLRILLDDTLSVITPS